MNRCITNEMNQSLMARYGSDEIIVTVKAMVPTKASGPNGFAELFFRTY